MRRLPALALALVTFFAPLDGRGNPSATQSASSAQIRAEKTELLADSPSGRVLRGADLIGAELELAGGVRVHVDGVEQLDTGPWAYRLSYRTVPTNPWASLCKLDPHGQALAFPIHRYALRDGTADRERIQLVCSAGAAGKCLRFGYTYWGEADGGSGLERYRACIRMVRADYCGDGRATTRNGMQIDIFDDDGIREPDPVTPLPFEAGWTSRGAVCVNHPRVPENVALTNLARGCPRLLGAPLGDACTKDVARARGAVIFNGSAAAQSSP